MAKAQGLTPMMEQYSLMKKRHPDALLMVRLGDFYELFNEDAEIASRELGLYLTAREIGSGNRMPMCGVPHHALDEYLPQLVRKGYKVAVADQLEDPKASKGLVKRDVTRVVSPGLLEGAEGANNYLAAIYQAGDGLIGLAYCDANTGEFKATQFEGPDAGMNARDEIERLSVSELLVPENLTLPHEVERLVASPESAMSVTIRPQQDFSAQVAASRIASHFESQGLEGFGLLGMHAATGAAGAALAYLTETQKQGIGHITGIGFYRISGFMYVDRPSWRNLAVFGNERSQSKSKGILDVIDHTQTRMGSRLIRSWLEAPLMDPVLIDERLDSVEELFRASSARERLKESLGGIADVEKLASKVAYANATPRDMAALAKALRKAWQVKGAASVFKTAAIASAALRMAPPEELVARLEAALDDELPADASSGGFIRRGYNAQVDELRQAAQSGREWLAALEAKERERSGIKNLRIGFNQVFGYYFEVSRSNAANVPDDFIRKQTLAGSERFYTPELKDIENKVLGAEEKKTGLELRLFSELVESARNELPRIIATAGALAEADVMMSFAEAAFLRKWVRPAIDAGLDTVLKDARHPVMEAAMPEGRFVENDIELLEEDARLLILTGPNMAGKSTVLATAGLVQLLAQAGSFVPCSSAKVGICDRIFYRAGSYDDISQGKSTFMVELLEVAAILNTGTQRSLVLVDELGRGTSTYDGMALAWAVAEHLHDEVKARSIFTTHYHELAELEEKLPFARNYHVAVAERPGEITFLYKLRRGGTDKSYGINVARMAGLPRSVIRRAGLILKELERIYDRGGHQMKLFGWGEEAHADESSQSMPSRVAELIEGADPEGLSPRDALDLLFRLKQALEEEKRP